MKTLVESIFDDDQTYVNKSGEVELHRITEANQFEKWLKDNDLLLSESDAKKVYAEVFRSNSIEGRLYTYEGMKVEKQKSNYNHNRYFIEYVLYGKDETLKAYIISIEIDEHNQCSFIHIPSDFYTTDMYEKKYEKRIIKALGEDWEYIDNETWEYKGKK